MCARQCRYRSINISIGTQATPHNPSNPTQIDSRIPLFKYLTKESLSTMAPSLPSNVHVSTHPCVRAKLSQLRSSSTNARETKSLVHEIATLVACDALAHGLTVEESGTVSFHPDLYHVHFPIANVPRSSSLRTHPLLDTPIRPRP